jgi:hypothetical protein
MFKAFSFALAMVLCTSVWSAAHTATKLKTFGPVVKPLAAEIFGKETAAHPIGPEKRYSPFQSIREGLHTAAAFVTDVRTVFPTAWVCEHWCTTFKNYVEHTLLSSDNENTKDDTRN